MKKVLLALIVLNGVELVINIATCDLSMALAGIVAIGMCVWAYDNETKGGSNGEK